ncbi:hypothetical protein CQA53_11275, partial [Helicobacter didelphidarum]
MYDKIEDEIKFDEMMSFGAVNHIASSANGGYGGFSSFVSNDHRITFIIVYKMDTNPTYYEDEDRFAKYILDEVKNIIQNRDKFPKVTDRIKFKGTLRIAWSYDMKYNKHIDLIFFPEENPYLNYAYLYAKDFPKKISNEDNPREIIEMKPNYDINYEFVKEILSKAGMDTYHRKRFFEVRFGTAMFVPMEIEFEWYLMFGYDDRDSNLYDDETEIGSTVKNIVYHDNSLFGVFYLSGEFDMCIGVIKEYSILSHVGNLQISIIDSEYPKAVLPSTPFIPLPTNVLATTRDFDDCIVKVKSDNKNDKILAQLFSHNVELLIIKNNDNNECYIIDKKNKNLQKSSHATSESKPINPFYKVKYLIYVQNILPNNWAKVWVIKPPKFFNDNGRIVIDKSYMDTFHNSPSQIKLYEGYIHTSGLDYLMPFGE